MLLSQPFPSHLQSARPPRTEETDAMISLLQEYATLSDNDLYALYDYHRYGEWHKWYGPTDVFRRMDAFNKVGQLLFLLTRIAFVVEELDFDLPYLSSYMVASGDPRNALWPLRIRSDRRSQVMFDLCGTGYNGPPGNIDITELPFEEFKIVSRSCRRRFTVSEAENSGNSTQLKVKVLFE